MKDCKYIIGIDEVGRGPIAGPVTVCAVLLPNDYSWNDFYGLKDSKKLTPKHREEWFLRVRNTDNIFYEVSSVSEKIIDSRGIVPSIQIALNKSLNKLLDKSLDKLDVNPEECFVFLDGGLHAPEEFINQRTIIRGDEKEYAIALASIMAKVTRDRKMVQFSKKYPEYDFDSHKGYGTKKHYEQIKKYGMCDLHRRSFLKNL